jgi:ribokinase
LVGRIGDDAYGDQLLSALAAEAIDGTHVHRDASTGTGVAVILVEESGENAIVVVKQANALLSVADVRTASDTIAAASVLLLQCEVPDATVLAAAEVARAAGTSVVLNTAPAELPTSAFRGLVDYVVANEIEAASLTGVSVDGDGNARAAAQLRVDSGARGVVLTLGERGVLVDEGEQTLLAAHEVTCVDTVGAGDAFCGALGSALARGATLLDAVRYGNAAGALAVGSPGAATAMPTRAAVEALLMGSCTTS